MIRNVGLYVGSFTTAGVGVFEMDDFNILKLSFWATLIGILFFTMIGGALAETIFEIIKKQFGKWQRGIGQTPLKDL